MLWRRSEDDDPVCQGNMQAVSRISDYGRIHALSPAHYCGSASILIPTGRREMSSETKKSQWQRYIDDALLKTDQVSMAAIHGLDGTEWASSRNFQVRELVYRFPWQLAPYCTPFR